MGNTAPTGETKESKILETPILQEDGSSSKEETKDQSFPTPTGKEYDLIDNLAKELPGVIDDESKRQVEEYITACDGGKGPMVACFSTAEYLSLFERQHKRAEELYVNACFRPKGDKSPNGVEVDGTMAYPPACFNLAQMRMTGKGRTKFDRKEAFDLFDRACRAGHGGSCYLEARMLSSDPGKLGPGIPYDPHKASQLLSRVCDNGDSLSCFTLATMLLRGDLVRPEADNVTPQEARGTTPIQKRENEPDRKRAEDDDRIALRRDPPRAEKLLQHGCDLGHGPSCYNLAVMYVQGDDNVPADPQKAELYKQKTEKLINTFGGFGFGGM
mmetsp:Transcript_9283/g.14420  ORF Transcript_9283/g.14420 Transcript_9283/m.14420 type:complete len:329 (+) Transcript_9283:21-1007(+)